MTSAGECGGWIGEDVLWGGCHEFLFCFGFVVRTVAFGGGGGCGGGGGGDEESVGHGFSVGEGN